MIDRCIKKSPEAFFREAKDTLDRNEAELEKNAKNSREIKANLETIKATVLVLQQFAPEIHEFRKYLCDIDRKVDEVNKKLDDIKGDIKNIRAILGKSGEYSQLTKELAELEEAYNAIPDSNSQVRIRISKQIESQKQAIEAFRQDVLRMAETFSKITIDSERLRQAQAAFESGDFKRTGELLNATDLESDQKRLLALKEERRRKKDELDNQLRHNATEYLIKAQATELDLSNPNRFEETKTYYLQSIRSCAFHDNLFGLAYYHQRYNRFDDAEATYLRIFSELGNTLPLENRALTLNNLAILHKAKNEFGRAEDEFSEALTLYRNLANSNPSVYLLYVAKTLNNLAILHETINKTDLAEREFAEAQAIRKEIEKN